MLHNMNFTPEPELVQHSSTVVCLFCRKEFKFIFRGNRSSNTVREQWKGAGQKSKENKLILQAEQIRTRSLEG